MPEIGEVARVVHYIRKNLIGKTLTTVTANVDDIVYGKVGTSAAEFEKHMRNKKVVDAGQQGKYFWMIMSSPPHPVMHLGMSGWFKFQNEHTFYYRKKAGEDEEWPPKFAKFVIQAKQGKETTDAAFVDMRRLARIRLIDCDGKEIRKHTPLKENGPDPVVDKDFVTIQWLKEMCNKKKVPIKAMLLDQAVISGIGNWVGDEIMYNAKMHPEQYANTLSDAQIEQLHGSIHYICDTACDLLADSEQFPDDWIFKYRWGKGKKDAPKALPNGNRIEFLKVGGRTSAVIPAVQKKTSPVAADISHDADSEEQDDIDEVPEKPKRGTKKKKAAKGGDDAEPPKTGRGRKRKAEEEDEVDEVAAEAEDEVEAEAPSKKAPVRGSKKNAVKVEESPKSKPAAARRDLKRSKKNAEVKEEEAPQPKTTTKTNAKGKKSTATKASSKVAPEEDTGRRRSGRLRK